MGKNIEKYLVENILAAFNSSSKWSLWERVFLGLRKFSLCNEGRQFLNQVHIILKFYSHVSVFNVTSVNIGVSKSQLIGYSLGIFL